MSLDYLILAAGLGTRMKSEIPKVLHKILGKPMLYYLLKTIDKLQKEMNGRKIVVIGYKGELVKKEFENEDLIFVEQNPPLGTGHAVMCAKDVLKNGAENTMVLVGDAPLLSHETLKNLYELHKKEKASCTILTAEFENPGRYGRIVREGRNVKKIVEAVDASPEELKIKEINSGIYVFNTKKLLKNLTKIKPDNVKKEYYLTDVVEILAEKGEKVCAYKTENPEEIIGINDRKTLSNVEKIILKKIVEKFQLEGVTFENPETVYIEPDVKIGEDTFIEQGVRLLGNTEIGKGCKIGAFTTIKDSKISDNSEIGSFCYIENAELL